MLVITHKLVLISNLLVSNQISSQNLPIFQYLGLKLAFFVQIMAKNGRNLKKLGTTNFRRKVYTILEFLPKWAQICYAWSLWVPSKTLRGNFSNFDFLAPKNGPKCQILANFYQKWPKLTKI